MIAENDKSGSISIQWIIQLFFFSQKRENSAAGLIFSLRARRGQKLFSVV